MLLFEWDREKAKKNLLKHNVSFDEAMTIFYDPLSATFDDPDHSVGEQRFNTIGYSSLNHLPVVSHIDRKEVVRIISARYETKKERKKHED